MAITLLPASPNGEITHLEAREKINECAASLNTPFKRNRFVFLENYSSQTPAAQDTPMIVTWGGTSTNGKVNVDAAGKATCVIDGSYDFTVTVQSARSSSGGTSWNYLAILFNGVQALGSLLSKHASANSDRPEQLRFTVDMVAGDELEIEFWVGSEGASDGFLEAVTPARAGVNQVPSARLAIAQYESIT